MKTKTEDSPGDNNSACYKMSPEELASKAEAMFNMKNTILITFNEHEFNNNTIKRLHSGIKEVHLLETVFVPKKRCILETDESQNAKSIQEFLHNKNFENYYLTAEFVKKTDFSARNQYIDPYSLYVKNLPSDATNKDIETLFPTCEEFKFITTDSSTDALVQFYTTENALIAYKTINNIVYKSNVLIIQFNRQNTNEQEQNQDIHSDYKEDVIDYDNEYNSEDINTERGTILKRNSISEDTNFNSLANRTKSNTLFVQNLPKSVTRIQLRNLFPNSLEYDIQNSESTNTKNAIVRFANTNDAVKCFVSSNQISFKSHILHIEFYNNNNESVITIDETDIIKIDISDDEDMEETRQPNNEVDENEDSEDCVIVTNDTQKTADIILVRKVLSEFQYGSNHQKKEDQIDPYTLHVQNLPLTVSYEELRNLFPACYKYQIFRESTERNASALVCFKNVQDSIAEYKKTRNMLFKLNFLTVKFKSADLSVNQLAFMKRKSDSNESDTASGSSKISSKQGKIENKKRKIETNEKPAEVILNEDDFEYESEEDDYYEDIGAQVDPSIEIEEEEDLFEDDECQELEDNETFLPQDEDDV